MLGGEKLDVLYAFAKHSGDGNSTKPSEKKQQQSPKNNAPKQQPTKTDNANKKQQVEQEKVIVPDTIYVGQIPENVEESDIKKLFPKSTKVEVFPAKRNPKGDIRHGFAFVSFSDDNSAAAAIKMGPSLKVKSTQLTVAYRTKRPTS